MSSTSWLPAVVLPSSTIMQYVPGASDPANWANVYVSHGLFEHAISSAAVVQGPAWIATTPSTVEPSVSM
jgi:hypothetical protein